MDIFNNLSFFNSSDFIIENDRICLAVFGKYFALGSVDPHIFADPGSQNVADPKHWLNEIILYNKTWKII